MYVQNWEQSRGKNGVVEPRKALQCPKDFSTPLSGCPLSAVARKGDIKGCFG